MKIHCTFTRLFSALKPCLLSFLILLITLGACGRSFDGPQPNSAAPTLLFASPTFTPDLTPALRLIPTAAIAEWPVFEPSQQAAPTAVPDSAPRLLVEDEVEIWLLLATGLEAPYRGRTDAFHLLIFNERLARAALVSFPGSLYVFLPGYTMQRLSTAYALGGFDLVNTVLAYNFGIRAQRFVLTHPQEFAWLISDLGGLELSVLYPIRDACGGIPAGLHSFDAEKALCYVSFISNDDEVDRVRRQQQVLQLLFNKMVQDGRIAMLPVLYASYQANLETDLGLTDLLTRIPLALKLGDPQRIAYYLIGWDYLLQWELPDDSQTKVLLPNTDLIQVELEAAIAFVMQAAPLSERVLTLEAQATQAMAATHTAIALLPPTQMATATYTLPSVLEPTPSPIWQTPVFTTPQPLQPPFEPYPVAPQIPLPTHPYP